MEYPSDIWKLIMEYLKPVRICSVCEENTSKQKCVFCYCEICGDCVDNDICVVCNENCIGFCNEKNCKVIGMEGEILYGCENCFSVYCREHYGDNDVRCKNCDWSNFD